MCASCVCVYWGVCAFWCVHVCACVCEGRRTFFLTLCKTFTTAEGGRSSLYVATSPFPFFSSCPSCLTTPDVWKEVRGRDRKLEERGSGKEEDGDADVERGGEEEEEEDQETPSPSRLSPTQLYASRCTPRTNSSLQTTSRSS